MKTKMRKILLFFILIILSISSLGFKSAPQVSQNGSSEIVMELNSNRILHQKNAKDKKFMASTTKILTAITIIENCDLTEKVKITEKTVGVEGSSIYLEEGEVLSVKDLLYGLMLRSGNDCAETLAVHCSGTIKDFALLMNKTAQKIGALDSNFVNPHGLHDDNHYTTAYDLSLISCYAMKNDDFREIVGTKTIKIPHTNREYDRVLVNKNKMLNEFDGATGIKTGYTKKAGRCLVSSCLRNGMELISVVLNCPTMFEKSKEILTTCFNAYQNYKIIESDNIVGFCNVEDSSSKRALIVKNDIVLPLTNEEYQNLNIAYNYPKILPKNQNINTEIGFIEIYHKNNLIFKEKIYTIL